MGRDTDWDLVGNELQVLKDINERWAGNSPRLAQLLTSKEESNFARGLTREPREVVAKIEAACNGWLGSALAQGIHEGKITFSYLERLLLESATPIERVEATGSEVIGQARKPIPNLASLLELVDFGARLMALEEEHSRALDSLQADFRDRFDGFETDWVDIQAALEWTQELMQKLPLGGQSPQLVAQAQQPKAPSIYESMMNSAVDVVQYYSGQIKSLDDSYDLDAGPEGTWEQTRFDKALKWTQLLAKNADSASDWLTYRYAVSDLDEAVGSNIVDSIRQETDDSGLVPLIVERRILGTWLDHVYQTEPLLAGFTSSEHENLIAKFRELDQRLPLAAQAEVRKKVLERYPAISTASPPGSELGILRNELSKKRRRWATRKLFRTIPNLIQTIKPCFLVSPLAVSQFLQYSSVPSETVSFDVVIFDEASQVFPEDAAPAILRGNQLILAGDQKQLPPNTFWRRSMAEDETDFDDEDDDALENPFVGKDSILDVAVGLAGRLFDEAHLNVHYRSKDENLIRFSNHHFYRDRLLTFPSPGVIDSWYGVHDVYVPDGRYDAGATRTNRKEAEQVVELVFQHMRNRPQGESIGVVALSRPQADLIDTLIEERRILERDVDEYFKRGLDEPFFVKNLENVQGDERDHMIISIGYGPTVGSGAVPNRFGPVNATGGERRLNVVITRARQRMDIVHSLRVADIRSEQEGARLLRRFLEYIQSPHQYFESQVATDPDTETESPFEDAVEEAIMTRGYRVARQVGVAGYRIDLAILSEDGTHYDLGVECDGWTYHSAPAARDRDWLRQNVLEGLGWRIHRVWSTAWVRNPEAELSRIESALAEARSRRFSPTTEFTQQVVDPPNPDESIDIPIVEIVPDAPSNLILEGYKEAELKSPPRWAELRYETTQNLRGLITQIAQVEGPVHKEVIIDRIRQRFGLARVRGATRDHLENAILSATRDRVVESDGHFIWANDAQLERTPRLPPDGNIQHVPPSELEAIVVAIVGACFGVPRRDLTAETARRLGFARTGGRIAEILDSVVQRLLENGNLVETFGMLRLPS